MVNIFPRGEGEGVEAAHIVLELQLHDDVEYEGSSYKVVKMMYTTGCPGSLPPAEQRKYVSVSPLYTTSGTPLLQVVKGWARSVEEVRRIRLAGGMRFRLKISWAGPGREAAEWLVNCIAKSGLADVKTVGFEMSQILASEFVRGVVELETPAQFKVKVTDRGSVVVQYPQPHRLLQHGLDLLVPEPEREEVYKEIDYYTVLANARVTPVTVVLDSEKPTNWAVSGRYELALAGGAPSRVRSLVGQALRLVEYTGVGKSRWEGFGVVAKTLLIP